MRRPLTVGLAGLVVLASVVLGVAQLVLPGIAVQHVRSQLADGGRGVSVSISASPAIELLWHHADRVTIHMRSYIAGTTGIGSAIGQAGDVGRLTVTVATARLGPLTVHDARLSGRSGRLSGSATLAESDLRGAVPFLSSVTPVASSDGQLTLRGTADVLGLQASVDADIAVRDGAIVVAPDVPLGALATITVFSNPHVTVTGLTATPVSGGFRVAGAARVH